MIQLTLRVKGRILLPARHALVEFYWKASAFASHKIQH
jgi:hypothetical protein